MNLNEIKFPKQKVFFYAVCTEDKMTQVISEAEEEGCSLVQVMAGMMPEPRSPLALPNAQPRMLHVLKILVRAPEKVYNALLAKSQKEAGAN